jgi:hypothetical protein
MASKILSGLSVLAVQIKKEVSMPYGYTGKILHVDLSTGSLQIEEPPEAFLPQVHGRQRHGLVLYPA